MRRYFEEFDFTAWRTAMGFTQRESAEALCCDIRSFQKWEDAGRGPRLAVKHAELLLKLREIA